MLVEVILQIIEELRAKHIKRIDEQLASYTPFSILETTDYDQGAIDVLEDLRNIIKERYSKECLLSIF